MMRRTSATGALFFLRAWLRVSSITRVVMLISLPLLLASCGFNSQKKVTIRFWNGFTGPDGRTILRIIKTFNKEHPDIRVLMQRMEWGTFYNKVFVAGLGGRAPEIFVIHASNMERFMRADFLRGVDDLIADYGGLDPSDFSENVWQAVSRGDKHFGIPLDVHALGAFYNRKLFRDAGIVDSQGQPYVPQKREEFEAALKKLTRKDNDPSTPDQWGLAYTWLRTNAYTIMCQFGAKFFSEDGEKCLLDSPEGIAGLQWCSDLIRKQGVAAPPENYDSWIGFRQGRVGVALEGIYMLPDLQKQNGLDYGAAPAPQIGPEKAVWADSHILCFNADMDEEHLRASWEFVKYLSDHSLDWALGGQIPVRRSLLESEEFRKMTIQHEFAKQIPYIRYLPRTPLVTEFCTEFDLAVERVLRGSATPEVALREARERVDAALERDRAARREIEESRK